MGNSEILDILPQSSVHCPSSEIASSMLSEELLILFILLTSGAAISMAVDLALGIRWQRFKAWKWLVHITTLILYGAFIAAYIIFR